MTSLFQQNRQRNLLEQYHQEIVGSDDITYGLPSNEETKDICNNSSSEVSQEFGVQKIENEYLSLFKKPKRPLH